MFQVSTGPNNKGVGSGMYHYDSVGRRFNWHATLVMVKGKDAQPIIHDFTWQLEALKRRDFQSPRALFGLLVLLLFGEKRSS